MKPISISKREIGNCWRIPGKRPPSGVNYTDGPLNRLSGNFNSHPDSYTRYYIKGSLHRLYGKSTDTFWDINDKSFWIFKEV